MTTHEIDWKAKYFSLLKHMEMLEWRQARFEEVSKGIDHLTGWDFINAYNEREKELYAKYKTDTVEQV